MYVNYVNLTVRESRFYQNESPMYGGASGSNHLILAGIDPQDGDPMKTRRFTIIVSRTISPSIPATPTGGAARWVVRYLRTAITGVTLGDLPAWDLVWEIVSASA